MLADIGLGMILTVFISNFFDVSPSGTLLLYGILFSLLPDFDFLVALLTRKKGQENEIGSHRDIAHFPFVYVLTFVIILFLFGKFWATLFGFCILFHFLHDSVGIGWGVKWLWPFSDRAYRFFSDESRRVSFKIASWNPEELRSAEEKYGDPNWIRNFYFRPTLTSLSEFFIFILGLVSIFFFWYK